MPYGTIELATRCSALLLARSVFWRRAKESNPHPLLERRFSGPLAHHCARTRRRIRLVSELALAERLKAEPRLDGLPR